jgi:hypothetical protein
MAKCHSPTTLETHFPYGLHFHPGTRQGCKKPTGKKLLVARTYWEKNMSYSQIYRLIQAVSDKNINQNDEKEH